MATILILPGWFKASPGTSMARVGMAEARSHVVTATSVIAAFLSLTRPAAHARTTMSPSASPSSS
jgi:hypothetical protein